MNNLRIRLISRAFSGFVNTKQILAASSMAAIVVEAIACPSSVTLNINSSNYSGRVDIEFRIGKRPGSVLVQRDYVMTSGSVVMNGICPGTYFFAFSTPDTDRVSLTQYFEVMNDGSRYSNPVTTVTYSRSASGGQRVGSAKRSDL